MKFELDSYHRNVSDIDLIEDLASVAKKLEKNSVTAEEYDSDGKYHSCTIRRRFGSWFRALERAGLQKTRTPVNIPTEDLFRNLEDIWLKLGRQPKYKEVRLPLSRYSAGTYEKRFGSWRSALEKFIEYIKSDVEEQRVETKEPITDNKQEIKHKTKREISERLRFRILMRDGFTCKRCGRSPVKELGVELHVDHIIPWSQGGETIPENLETKCKECNLGKGNAFNV